MDSNFLEVDATTLVLGTFLRLSRLSEQLMLLVVIDS